MHTHEYFMSECHAFLTLLGSRTFWKLPFENREGSVDRSHPCIFRCEREYRRSGAAEGIGNATGVGRLQPAQRVYRSQPPRLGGF
jgi:hypothetical protein